MSWIAEMSDGSRMLVPVTPKNESENILKHGLKALMRRMLRSRNYIRLVSDGITVKKFINARTAEELMFHGSHAGFVELFSALMETQGCNKVFYHQIQKLVGYNKKTDQEPLDFEGSVVKSTISQINRIGSYFHQEMTGKQSFMVVEEIKNHKPGTPFLIEHHFTFRS